MRLSKIILSLFFILQMSGVIGQHVKYAVVISANTEWKSVRKKYPDASYLKSPWGEYFFSEFSTGKSKTNVLFFHEGWGKTAAAGGTQYVIDKFSPEVIINIGTCGGFEGEVERFDIILANQTIIYDIREAMGDSKEAIAAYTTEIDLSWLRSGNFPAKVRKALLVSADRDLVPEEIAYLKSAYNAVAGDWESGSIAYVCKKNNIKILILRGVTDLVNDKQGEAINNFGLFEERTGLIMMRLLDLVPGWIQFIEENGALAR
jgi:adenosylhomocysteine nucleosidase